MRRREFIAALGGARGGAGAAADDALMAVDAPIDMSKHSKTKRFKSRSTFGRASCAARTFRSFCECRQLIT
jgi:hypothetical protein